MRQDFRASWFEDWLNQNALRLCGILMTWAHVRMAKRRGWNWKAVRHVSQTEQNAIWNTVRKVVLYQASEAEVLEMRLSRRYDIGMAMNEAANRAIAQKQAVRDPQLTGRQLVALKVQEEYLQRIVKRS